MSPDGRFVLYSRKDLHPAGRQVWLVDIDGEDDHEILNFGDSVKTYASWFPDGERLLVLSEAASHRRVGTWSLADGRTEWVLDDPDRNVEDAYVPFGSEKIVVVEVRGARTRSSLLDPDSRKEAEINVGSGNLVPLAPYGGDEWIGLCYGSRQPGDIVRFSVTNPSPTDYRSISRTWNRTSLTPDDFVQAQEYQWVSVDGLEIQGWLYRPGQPQRVCGVRPQRTHRAQRGCDQQPDSAFRALRFRGP